jgi:hypothetical protein
MADSVTSIERGIAAPRTIDVPVMGGAKKITIRPWSMAQQDECLPLVAKLIDDYTSWQQSPEVFTLGELVLRFHAEVRVICEATARKEMAERGISWDDDLWGEDLFGLAQAIWETSISRPGGGGVLGKMVELVGPLLLQQLQRRAETPSATSPTSETSDPTDPPSSQSSGTSSPMASPSSPADGDEALRPSELN